VVEAARIEKGRDLGQGGDLPIGEVPHMRLRRLQAPEDREATAVRGSLTGPVFGNDA
jgi:hypothetical protein